MSKLNKFDIITRQYLSTGQATEFKITGDLINDLKALKVIKLDNFGSFFSFLNYDFYIIFKVDDEYYFCETSITYSRGVNSLVKLINYNQILRKEKINKINNS